MIRSAQRRLAALLAPLLLVAASPARAGDVLGFVRLESLDAAAADAEVLARAAGLEFNRDQLAVRALGAFGVSDASILDPARPLAVALPVEGMALNAQGLVAVVPVRSAPEALDRIAAQFKTRSLQGAVHSFSTFSGPSLYARTEASYLILGQSRDLVAALDPQAVLRWGGPAGSFQFEVFLDPVVPTIQAGLQKAKEEMKEQLQQQAAASEGAGASPEGLEGVFDLYFDLFRSFLSNVTRFQAALGRTAQHVVLRKKLQAKPGSALADFGAAQKPAASRLPRLLEPGATFLVADVTATPAFRALLKDFVRRYLTLAERLVREVGNEGGSGPSALADFWTALTPEAGPLAERWVDCVRGDYAATFDVTEGLSFAQLSGHLGGDSCRTLVRDGVDALKAVLARLPETNRFFTVEQGPIVGSVTGHTVRMDVAALLRALAPPKAARGEAEPEAGDAAAGGPEPTDRLTRFLYGDGAYSYLWADLGDASLYLGGVSAEARLRRLVEAGEGRAGAGIGPEAFAPLDPGPGISWALDAGRLLEQVRARLPAEERAQLDEATQALSGSGARVAARVGFDSTGIGVQLAVPLKLVELGGKLAPPAAEDEAPEDLEEPEEDLPEGPEGEPTRQGPRESLPQGGGRGTTL